MKIHPTAIVDSAAELADSVEVQAFTIIGPHVQIGEGSVVGPHCVLEGRTVIGKNNHIYSGSQIGVLSQDLKHDPACIGRTVIGDHNQIREHVTISASTIGNPDEDDRVTAIGNHCLFMANAHVAHDCRVGNNVIMANGTALSGHVHVEDKVNIGGLSGVHQFCVVGTMVMVGGMTRVWNDVPPYLIVDGNPARCRGPNTVGLRRHGVSKEGQRQIKAMYKIMFMSGLNTTQALHRIEDQVDDGPERRRFVEFVRASIRGITPGVRPTKD